MANTHSIDLELSSSQYLEAGDSVSLSIIGDLTIECWVKLESFPGSDIAYGLVGKVREGGLRSYWVYFYSTDGTNGRLYINTSTNGSNNYDSYVAWTPSIGVWYHIAIVYDASETSATFYVNGSQQGNTQTDSAPSIADTTAPLDIGASRGNETFDGLIDDVRIWNDVRSAAEIAANYQTELVGNEAGLVGYWKLNNSLLDETANDNDLTNVNSAVFSTDVPFGGPPPPVGKSQGHIF